MIEISKTYKPNDDLVLFNGDCMSLLGQIPDEQIKLVVTSPPYNLGKEYEDKISINEYVEEQGRVIRECIRVLHPKGSICWQVGNYVENGEIIPLDVLLYPIFANSGLKLRNRIVWRFGHGLHASRRFSGRYEVIIWFTNSILIQFECHKNIRIKSISRAQTKESYLETL